ncbi:MAG TPA: DUF554 domain-containing protein [Aggregatilineaceae bacterium]|jgi:uncharacterized membrane protein YqgA involved in biofilm formation|nr:DUF554 domain-containing protein [Aggregatilineaceae bacterium]
MRGTLLNTITVLIGSSVGLLVGNRLPQRIQESVVTGLGLVTLFVGFSNAGETGNVIIPLLSLVIGAIFGELLQLDRRLDHFAGWLQARVQGRATVAAPATDPAPEMDANRRVRFIQGFVTASLVFCVGPLTFVGSIQDGMGKSSGFDQLAIKSALDGFASMAFAASLGIGVMFSVITVLGVQGGLALAGSLAGNFMTDAMTNEMTAVGGLILIGLALTLLDLKKPRVVNFLPGLLIAPVIVAIATALGINIYPPH